MNAGVPSLTELRHQLGRALVVQPDSLVLQQANRVLNAAFARQRELSPAVKLGAGRAVAIAMDSVRLKSLAPGQTVPLVSDYLDPAKQSSLGWWPGTALGDAAPPASRDLMLDLANALDRAQTSLRNGASEMPLDVANALDRAYQAVAESAKNVGRGAADVVSTAARSAILPVALAVSLMVAWGWSRRKAS